MVRLCTYHQKRFVRVLNDICTEVQPGCEGQQLPGAANMDLSTCSSGCSQYHTENQELGTSCSEPKHLPSLDPEQSGPHGSLRILCHALKQAVDLKSSDRRENCSPMVRRDFPELPNIRTNSASPRDSPTQGYLTTSNSHYSGKGLEGLMPGNEQEMGVRKGEDDKDQMQSRALLGGYIAAKASNVNTSEDGLESRLGSQKNLFKPFPDETREPVFSASSPRRADKENALQCSSKASLHPDIEINDQEARPKVDSHLQSVGKSKGGGHMHPVDKTHLEKDNWLPASPVPGVHHRTTNGHSRAKSISVSSKSTRKSKRSSGLRINDYDNQCDVVFISQPITECHFESKRAVSSRKTARKSTRGYYYNGECCELPTVRTLAKASRVQESGSSPSPRAEVLTSPSQAAAQVVSEDADKRSSSPVALPQMDSSDKKTQDTAEPCSAENNPPAASSAETPADALSPLACPDLNAEESSLSASSFQSAVVSSLQLNEQELQEEADTGDVLQTSSTMDDSCKSSSPCEDSGSPADSVPLTISETADGKENSLTLENIPEPSSPVNQEPSVSVDLLLTEELTARVDLLPPSEGSATTVDLPPCVETPADVELPLLSSIELAEPQAESSAVDSLDAPVVLPEELPLDTETVCSGELVASVKAASPVVLPASMAPETFADIDLESSEPPAVESLETTPGKAELELSQLHSSSDATELPACLQCGGANGSINTEPSEEGTQDREEEGQAGKSETVLPVVDIGENWEAEMVNDTGDTNKRDENREADGKAPPVSELSETSSKEAISSKISADKKRKREKKPQVVSDRRLRSQQSLSPTEDSSEPPSSSTSVQLPQLQIKLSKSPGAKRFKREVHLDGAASVSFPSDCAHETLLTDMGNTQGGESKQQGEDSNDITKEQTYENLLSAETAVDEGQNGDDKSKPGTMLEICLEANSDKRSVHVPVEISDEGEQQTTRNQESLENSDSAMEVREVLHTDQGIIFQPCPGSKDESKNAPLEKSMRYKKPSLQFYNLRHTPALPLVATVQKTTPGKVVREADSNVMDQQQAGNEDPIGFSSMEVLSENKPRFVEWCAEEENQELITNFNAQYMKVQKGWIQLEKEAPPAPKVKNKSDKLKEIWKSKKRTRKFKGSTEVQKLSPVQMLFVKAFNVSNICRWFMETTETKSLVIVKKMNTRLPGDIPLIKLPLQKGSSSGIYPSSLQAERLKKHLKKFAAMTPAKNTIKTQRLWARLREATEENEPEQVASPKQMSPSDVPEEHTVEAKPQPCPTTPVQTNSRILRKSSNLRSKLPGQHKVVKQEKNDCVTKQPSAESKPSRKSLCIKPLMSPKLTQQVKAAQLPTKPIPIEKGGKERKGKGKLQEDSPSKGEPQPSKKKSLTESSRAQGQLNKLPLKKPSKLKHSEARATRKQMATERSNKHMSQNEKVKKPQLEKKKPPVQKGKANTSQKVTLPSKQAGLAKPSKQKAAQDSSSRSLKVAAKKAGGKKALTRSMKLFQQNKKAQSKRKLGGDKNSSPCKRRRLDAK
uniref:ligand-dependent corepressor n=1 Tax=Euleptes europaea TaxID=460621 RepID=UPI0025403268|nr:ligand-dependent corepressor [Euleptes europaea]